LGRQTYCGRFVVSKFIFIFFENIFSKPLTTLLLMLAKERCCFQKRVQMYSSFSFAQVQSQKKTTTPILTADCQREND
jgi:hypothetical protein